MNSSPYFLPLIIFGAIILIALIAITFITRFGLLKSWFGKSPEVKFTKFDLNKCDTGLLTSTQFKEEVDLLIQKGYHLTSKKDVFDFVFYQTKLSEKSLVIILDDKSSLKIRSILPFLLKRNVNVIFFMPFILNMYTSQGIP